MVARGRIRLCRMDLSANGFGQEKDAQYDGQPDGWNEAYSN